MSYEGREEYICEKGHYFDADAMAEMYVAETTSCQICGGKLAWHHSVDETNGIVEEDPDTQSAPKKEKGYEDLWTTDHYNNRYAIKILLWEPASPLWKKYEIQN